MGSGAVPSTFCCDKNKDAVMILGLLIWRVKGIGGRTLENHCTRFASSVASLDLLMFPGGLR